MGVTREEFKDAVKKAQSEFVDMVTNKNETKDGFMTIMIMGLQNSAFASLIEKHLFGDEPTEEDTTIDE